MSEDTQNENIESHNEESSQELEESQQPDVGELQKQIEALRNKTQELLGETKAAKQKAREEAEAKERAKLEKAKREGDFEKLLKSSESEREKLSNELNTLRDGINKEKISNQSMKIASEIADGANAELLSEFISRRLQMTDDGLKVLDQSGNLTVSSVDDLKAEFLNDAKYKALIRGTKASGGGSQGSGDSGAATKTITRDALEKMSPEQRMDFFVNKGGKVVDN